MPWLVIRKKHDKVALHITSVAKGFCHLTSWFSLHLGIFMYIYVWDAVSCSSFCAGFGLSGVAGCCSQSDGSDTRRTQWSQEILETTEISNITETSVQEELTVASRFSFSTGVYCCQNYRLFYIIFCFVSYSIDNCLFGLIDKNQSLSCFFVPAFCLKPLLFFVFCFLFFKLE